MKIKPIALCLALAASAIPMAAFASATGSQSVTLNANATDVCSFTANSSSVDFKAYDWTSGTAYSDATAGAAEFTASCSKGDGLYFTAISTNGGTLNDATSDKLNYSMSIQPPTGTAYNPIGATSANAFTASGSGAGDAFALTLGMAAGQNVPAGSYSDSVAFTLNY